MAHWSLQPGWPGATHSEGLIINAISISKMGRSFHLPTHTFVGDFTTDPDLCICPSAPILNYIYHNLLQSINHWLEQISLCLLFVLNEQKIALLRLIIILIDCSARHQYFILVKSGHGGGSWTGLLYMTVNYYKGLDTDAVVKISSFSAALKSVTEILILIYLVQESQLLLIREM